MATEKRGTESKNAELKRLGFVRVAAIQALVCVSNLYEYAKQSSGPLRSTVGTVESAVTTVVGPVYDKFKGVPDDLLSFLDKKVDEATYKFDEHAPPAAKKIVSAAQSFVQKAAEKARKLVNEAQTAGPRAAVNYAAEESRQIAIAQTVNLWILLNSQPSIHPLAEKAAPTMAQWSEKYNSAVKDLTRKGYPVVGYLPFVPVDEISTAIKQGEAKKETADSSASTEHKEDSSASTEHKEDSSDSD